MMDDIGILQELPRAALAHVPTPLEAMPNLTRHFGKADLWIKRDDCTGLAMGGNKARQLEFYLGAAQAQGADTILITGAVQSNFTRMAAAGARKLGMECHIQMEKRVASASPLYYDSGNVLISKMLGATLHSFEAGEDEAGADRRLEEIATALRANGQRPYVIHLGPDHPPLGALGYVAAAGELLAQMAAQPHPFDAVIVASGSGATHAGLLFGLRALGSDIAVKGICVRRAKDLQTPRIARHCVEIAKILQVDNPVTTADINLNDDALAPGYGQMNAEVLQAISLLARLEGIILDPVYTGRTMAGFLDLVGASNPGQRLMFLHSGGQPAVFGYAADLAPLL